MDVRCHAGAGHLVEGREMDEGRAFERERPRLVSLAYRMLGSAAEAEDVVQEAFVRLHQAAVEGVRVESPAAYLTTITTRLAIDQLRSARVRRETYVGTWLPEPILTDEGTDVAEEAELADSMSMAFLLVLETLSPVERAVFLLHDVFGYEFDEVAPIVEKSAQNTRQIAVRARKHVEARRPRFEPSERERDELARRFFAAARAGDMEGLVRMLADDAVMVGDGGGKAPALSEPVRGAERVARFMLGLGRLGERLGLSARPVHVNGQPGFVAVDAEERIVSVTALEIADGKVHAVRSVVNPEKLDHLGDVVDLRRMLAGI
jgi:RNA polymerase sigma-70 factor (ECF subfamily)